MTTLNSKMKKEEVTTLLSQLGKNCDKIAETLLQKGYRGRKDSLKQCPIARYLSSKGVKNVTVYPTFIIFGEEGERVGIDTSEVITAFINRFDKRKYRELESS